MAINLHGVRTRLTFEILFTEEALVREYRERFFEAKSRGLDRANGEQYGRRLYDEMPRVSEKCLAGGFRFTPYVENLKLKDRHSAPRLISIPTVRDRIVLSQLNKVLRIAFPEETKARLAGSFVRELASEVLRADPAENWTAGSDIKKFYDSIDRTRLLKLLGTKIKDLRILTLVRRAIETPTVPKTYRSSETGQFRCEKGIPQGLAISNALAAIYLSEVDIAMSKMPVKYFRFVDDVLILGGKSETLKAQRSFAARVRARGLSVHNKGSKKGHHLPLNQRFGYLGYVFQWPTVTVRESTIERLLHSLAAKLADYRHNKEAILRRRPYLTIETLQAVFIDELNERISGAISGNRKYGWIAYFSEITDLAVLHRIDSAVAAMFSRVPEFAGGITGIKRFARAYFEIKFRPKAGYVRDYDSISTPAQMIKFLQYRGQVGPGDKLTEAQIVERFEAYRESQLSKMLADEAAPY